MFTFFIRLYISDVEQLSLDARDSTHDAAKMFFNSTSVGWLSIR